MKHSFLFVYFIDFFLEGGCGGGNCLVSSWT